MSDTNLPKSSSSENQPNLFESLFEAAAESFGERITPQPRNGHLPLSFGQQRFWFLDQYDPGNPVYHVSRAYRIEGVIDLNLFEKSINRIIQRHEILRTCFQVEDGNPVQKIEPSLEISMDEIDCSHLPSDNQVRVLEQQCIEKINEKFDLTRLPLMRASLFRLGENSHVLLIVMHHIISDGWSMSVLIDEVVAIYGALVKNASPQLPDLPIQYGDYAFWDQNRPSNPDFDAKISYWKEQLNPPISVLNFPLDFSRPRLKTYKGAKVSAQIKPAVRRKLEEFCERNDVTSFMVLLAVFNVLLFRYTKQKDLWIGIPTSNRNRAEVSGLIGFFVNTLVMRTKLKDDSNFKDVLEIVRNNLLTGLKHQDAPFERLVEILQPERDLSRSPLFQVFSQYRNYPEFKKRGDALTLDEYPLPNVTSQFDLALEFTEMGDHIRCDWIFNPDLFLNDSIQRLSNHLMVVLRAFLEDSTQPITDFSILTKGEYQQIVFSWNETQTPYPTEKLVFHFFEEQTVRTPDAVAVEWENSQFSYSEINKRSNQLAHYLLRRGTSSNELVGLLLERSPEMLIGVLGILKAGGACVPLDPMYPSERLKFMIEDSNVSMIVTQSAHQASLVKSSPNMICLDTEWAEIETEKSDNLNLDFSPFNLAYILYTSGSTGKPKGVAMSHRPLVNIICWQMQNSSIAQSGKTLQFASLNFDVSFQEIFATWATGGILVLISEDTRKDPFALIDFIRRRSINRMFLPFVALHQIAMAAQIKMIYPEHLREIITAGEQLEITSQIAEMFDRLDSCILINQYGPTETHIVTSFSLPGIPSEWPKLPSIGRPIANTKIYILDPQMFPVPVGVGGEIYIGGDCLALGYLDRPESTAERFLQNPFDGDGKERLYKTGDLARFKPDGLIEFLGRTDHQVKIRGFRIELGEIEITLGEHPGMGNAVVIPWGDSPDEKHLIAYLVLVPGREITLIALQHFLKEKLPDYMLPARYVILDDFPRAPSGKIDRQAFPLPNPDTRIDPETYQAPRNPLEAKLVAIWSDVLGLEMVGIHDNFFDLGGHSLSAVKMISKIRNVFGKEIPLISIFEYPTVQGLSNLIRDLEISQQDQKVLDPIKKIPRNKYRSRPKPSDR